MLLALAVLAFAQAGPARNPSVGGTPREATRAPEPPRVLVDATPVASTGKTVHAATAREFQAALDAAQLGDTITLSPDVTYKGPFTLPLKSGTGWITVQTTKLDRLPPAGTRVTPADARAMPKVITTSPDAALRTAAGAHHYRFRGIEFAAPMTTVNYGIVVLDGAPDAMRPMTTPAEVPHHLIFEQCFVHGHPGLSVSRGITTNSAHTAVIDSYISEIHASHDAQAIGSWNGPGPFKIVNNYLEASGENIMFGGAFASIPNLVASDIEIRRNHITKPLAWKPGEPNYDGSRWGIKNLLELKNAQRLVIDGNLFENHWASAQAGFAIVLTPRNEIKDGRWAMPWTTVSHVTFTNNVVRKVTAGVQIMGRENSDLLGYIGPRLSTPGVGFLIRNNLFDEIGTGTFNVPGSFAGKLFFITAGPTDVVIDHNTSSSLGSFLTGDDAAQTVSGFVYTNNLHPSTDYGIFASGKAPGAGVLQAQFPGAVVAKNAFIGSDAMNLKASYPDNFYLPSLTAAGLEDLGTGRLTAASRLKGRGTDGKDVGVDPDALTTARASASAVTPPPMPPITTAPMRAVPKP
jgi:hypothetical protein